MIRIGLTGSIGMGKSTTAGLFAEEGVPVNNSDAVVHQLYAGEAVLAIEQEFPGTTANGMVDRQKLAIELQKNPAKFKILETIVHPLVRRQEQVFIEKHIDLGADIVVLDIPLLFETRSESRVDKIVVVSCNPDMQRRRVMAREGMTAEKFELILSRQLPDAEKRARADFVIDTGSGLDSARQSVRDILFSLRSSIKED
jgi:dephospho-CoA kinase